MVRAACRGSSCRCAPRCARYALDAGEDHVRDYHIDLAFRDVADKWRGRLNDSDYEALVRVLDSGGSNVPGAIPLLRDGVLIRDGKAPPERQFRLCAWAEPLVDAYRHRTAFVRPSTSDTPERNVPCSWTFREFCRAAVDSHPSVALVTWVNPDALRWFLSSVRRELGKLDPPVGLLRLSGTNLDSSGFQARLFKFMNRKNVGQRCLLVHEIETLAPAAAAALNENREGLAVFRAVIVVIRENHYRDFMMACPDLMDWVGTKVARAEDFQPPLTLARVKSAIRNLEKRSGMPTKEFQEKWASGQLPSNDDSWFWNELVAIRERLGKGSKE